MCEKGYYMHLVLLLMQPLYLFSSFLEDACTNSTVSLLSTKLVSLPISPLLGL